MSIASVHLLATSAGNASHPGLDRYFGFPAPPAAGAPAAATFVDDATLRQRCRDLEREVADLRASWSWRLTGPLRVVLARLRGY